MIDAQQRRMYAEMNRLLAIYPLPPEKDVVALYEEFRQAMGWPYPNDGTPEETAWAAFHKARLHAIGSTRHMRRDSRRWLRAHGFTEYVEAPTVH